ncbi:hypothetical protein Z948_1948 [Sulfitobacter donghicola DSW-25 = KCTC 12864 = JCM 14565]|uniref:Uncharacterized protein n=1 Tax=Sulfitobacter donghicola DSW-25 = KCTC 12864 = JCM 14565 TaxID=1300350 RepID=A0A073ILA7_9RHOB|nr:hypothetical protein DSW25_03280 [Sulfitobacter donghicola DSW-25 = KCTC 12864 = JCM 14565]KIN68220.1 hypothetical protein Z948_1948 [Sulfitobacter donghicola DSW-25 = KCTC 12864 = JCM 14565]
MWLLPSGSDQVGEAPARTNLSRGDIGNLAPHCKAAAFAVTSSWDWVLYLAKVLPLRLVLLAS